MFNFTMIKLSQFPPRLKWPKQGDGGFSIVPSLNGVETMEDQEEAAEFLRQAEKIKRQWVETPSRSYHSHIHIKCKKHFLKKY